MRKKRSRGQSYKFTEKRHSIKGMSAFALAIISIILCIVLLYQSFLNRGNGSVYLGSGGILGLLVGVTSFFIAISSLGDESKYKFFSSIGVIFSFIASGIWILLYIIGIFFS